MVRWLSVVLLLLWVGARVAVAEKDPREDLLVRLNQERFRSGLPPLRLVAALSLAAQEHAEEISRRRSNRPEPGGTAAMVGRLQRVGYTAFTWNESILVARGSADQVIAQWRERDRRSAGLSPSFRDVGIGISDYYGAPLYTLLFGWHLGDQFARETAGLDDLNRVRAEMLSRVNAVRTAAGLPILVPDPSLDEAAQAHAQDLLARTYYSHVSPEGSTPMSRVQAAGYPAEAVAENLHQIAGSVEEVMAGWLHSPGHRRNILDPIVSELGVGVAVGPGYGLDPNGYRVIWVQNFGRPSSVRKAGTSGGNARTAGGGALCGVRRPSTECADHPRSP